MKRTPLKRGTSQLKRSGFSKTPTSRLKTSKTGHFTPKIATLAGRQTTKELKKDIQALLRQIVIIRDGGCVLRHFPETGACGSYTKAGNLILQGEHLNSRTHSGTYGDSRNIVCLCQRHHIYWKPQNSERYWQLIEKILPPKQWEWYQRAKQDTKAYKVDWGLVKIALEQELKTLSPTK